MESLRVGTKNDGVDNIVVDLEKKKTKSDQLSAEATESDKIEENHDDPCNDLYKISEKKYFGMDKEGYLLMHGNPVKLDTREMYENLHGTDDHKGKLQRIPRYII